MAQSVADLDPNLNTQIKNLQTLSAKQQQALSVGAQAPWMTPTAASGDGSWSGDLFDFQDMETPFDRSVSNQAFAKAIASADNSGTSADLIVTQTQVDYLAVMERAFRSRHTMRRPRALAHAIGRKTGHGNDKGPLVQNVLEYIRDVVKQGKS